MRWSLMAYACGAFMDAIPIILIFMFGVEIKCRQRRLKSIHISKPSSTEVLSEARHIYVLRFWDPEDCENNHAANRSWRFIGNQLVMFLISNDSAD